MTDTPHHPRPPHAPDGMTPEEHAAQLHPARDVSQDVPPSHRPGPERPVRFGDIAVALGFCSAPQVDHAERLQLDHASERGIGEVLVSERSITREQRDEVLGHQRITFVTRRHTGAPGSDMRLGKLAVDKGLIGYAQMVRGLELQAEARDVDGNTPPLGKVLIELGYFNEIDLYTLLQEIGVEVYRCESCRTVFNVIGRMPSRTFCCPVCHSQRVVEAPGQVLDVVGTLRPGGAPLVASATASGSSASASSVSLGTPGVDVAPATTAAQVANHAADLSVRSPLDNVAWPDATDTTFGLDVAMPDVSRADEWDESSSDAPAISTGDQQLADMVRDASAAGAAVAGAAGAAAPAPPDAVSPDASAEELSASDRVWQRAYRQTGHVPRKPSGKVTRQSGKVSPTSRTSRKVRTSTGKFVSLPGHDDSEGFDAASPLITASLPDTLRGARRSIGPYVIHEEIGRGDLGIVFRATHGQTNERVALKVILGGQARRSEYLERLESQSHVLRKLDHPGIARLIDTGRDGGIVYVASEYVEGKSLDRWAAEHWPTLDERVDIVIRLAEALAFAHDLNIVHRDVCPSNVIVDAFGNPRITDFGLPRPMAEDQVATVQGATRRFGRPVFAGTAALVGNPRYMAPEQLRAVPGVVLDGRTDQFALGVLAYEMVTGRHPFADSADTSLVAVLENVIHEEPPLVRQLVQDVPPDLESVIFRTLEKSRDRRYHGCLELAADLQRVILGEPVDAPSQTLFTRLRKQVERHPTRSLSTAVTVLLLFVLFGTWTGLFTEVGKLLRGNDSATHQPTSDDLRRAVLRSLNDAIDRGDMHTAARLISGLPVSVQRNAGEWLAVARFERIHGHIAEARDAIAHASAIEPTFDAAMLAGDLASEAGDVDAALTAWKDAARLEPTRSEPLISQLKTLQRERRFSDLADLAQAATSGAFAESSEMFAWRGLGEGMYNQLDKSRASLARAEELARARLAKAAERSDAEAERLLGELDQARVFWFRALVTMRRGVDDNEARPEELAAAAAELTRAREDLIAALQHDTRHELSGVLGALRTADLQLSRLRIQALSRQRDQELDRVERARLRLDLGQATSALDDVQQVFARDPAAATPEAGILYARALQAVGEDALARRAWAAIPRGTPADPAVFVGYGNFLLRTQTAQRVALGGVATVSGEDARLAAESFTRAMRADPWRVRALIGRARAMLELGYPHEAQRDLEHALAAAADKLNTVDAQLWLGVTAMRAGQRREGRRRLELASAVPERVEDATGALHAAALLMIDDALNGDPIAPARRRFATLRLHVPDVSFALAVEAGALIRMAASWPPPGYVPPAPAPRVSATARQLVPDGDDDAPPPAPPSPADTIRNWTDTAVTLLTDARRRITDRHTGQEAQTLTLIARLQVQLGRWEDARATWRLLLLDEFDRGNRNATRGLYQLPDSDEYVTLDKLMRYRRLDPRSVVLAELEATQLARDRGVATSSAAEAWARVRQLRPANDRENAPATSLSGMTDAFRLWAAVLADDGPRAGAGGVGARDSAEAVAWAEARLRAAQPIAARLVLDQTVGATGGDARIRSLRAEALLVVGRTAAARAELEQVLAIRDPARQATDPARLIDMLAACHIAEGRYDVADETLRRSLSVDANAPALRMLAAMRWLQGGSERETLAQAAIDRLNQLDLFRRDATLLQSRTGARADDEARLDQARMLYLRGQFQNAELVLRNAVAERLSSSRQGGDVQRLLLALGLSRISTDRLLARATLHDAAAWSDDQPGGTADSTAARIARQIVALLDGTPGTPDRPALASSSLSDAGVARDAGPLRWLLAEWATLVNTLAGATTVAGRPDDDVPPVWGRLPRLRLIRALRSLAEGRWSVAERELADVRNELGEYAQTHRVNPDSDTLPLPVVADLARALALGGAGHLSQAGSAVQTASTHTSGELPGARVELSSTHDRTIHYVKALLAWMGGDPARARTALIDAMPGAPAWLLPLLRDGRLLAAIASGNRSDIDGDLRALDATGGIAPPLLLRATWAAMISGDTELAGQLITRWPEGGGGVTAALSHEFDLVRVALALTAGDVKAAAQFLALARQRDPADPAVLRMEALLALARLTGVRPAEATDTLDVTGQVANRLLPDRMQPTPVDDASDAPTPPAQTPADADDATTARPDVPRVSDLLSVAASATDSAAIRTLLESMALRASGHPHAALRLLATSDSFQPRYAAHMAGEAVRAVRELDNAGQSLAGLEYVLEEWQRAPDSRARDDAMLMLRRERIPLAATLGRSRRVMTDATALLDRLHASGAATSGSNGTGSNNSLRPMVEFDPDVDRLRQWQVWSRLVRALDGGDEVPRLLELVTPVVAEVRTSQRMLRMDDWWRALERFQANLEGADRMRGRRSAESDAMAALAVFHRREPGASIARFLRASEESRLPLGTASTTAAHLRAYITAAADARLAVALEWVLQTHRLTPDWAPAIDSLPDPSTAMKLQVNALESAIAHGSDCLEQRSRTGVAPRFLDSSPWRLRVKIAMAAGEVSDAASIARTGWQLTGDPRVLRAALLNTGPAGLHHDVLQILDSSPDDLPDDLRARLYAETGAAAFAAGEFGRASSAWSAAALLDHRLAMCAPLAAATRRLHDAMHPATQ